MDLPDIVAVTRLPAPARAGGQWRVFVPALDRFPASARELMGVLPVCDINGDLMAALAAAPRRAPRHLAAGLFAADPFLDTRELAAALRRAGLAAVANYPTLQLLDGTAGEGLAAVGYHARAEFMRLAAFKAEGFDAFAYVASPQAAEEALSLGLTRLVVHGGLGAGGSGRAAGARIEALAAGAGAQLMRHAGFGAAAQPVRP